jgi:hypothetical protein
MASIAQGHARNWIVKHPRLFSFLMVPLNLYLTLDNWNMLRTEHRYWVLASFFCPMGAVYFGAATLFPDLISGAFTWQSADKPRKVGPMRYLVLIVSIVVGLLNSYSMTH